MGIGKPDIFYLSHYRQTRKTRINNKVDQCLIMLSSWISPHFLGLGFPSCSRHLVILCECQFTVSRHHHVIYQRHTIENNNRYPASMEADYVSDMSVCICVNVHHAARNPSFSTVYICFWIKIFIEALKVYNTRNDFTLCAKLCLQKISVSL